MEAAIVARSRITAVAFEPDTGMKEAGEDASFASIPGVRSMPLLVPEAIQVTMTRFNGPSSVPIQPGSGLGPNSTFISQYPVTRDCQAWFHSTFRTRAFQPAWRRCRPHDLKEQRR